MRHQGTIVSWDTGRGIGAIQWHGDQARRVFVRITDFPPGPRWPEVGDIVTYDPGSDNRGRPIATGIQYVHPAGHTPLPPIVPLPPAFEPLPPSSVPLPPAFESLPPSFVPLPFSSVPPPLSSAPLPPSFVRDRPESAVPVRRRVVPVLVMLVLIMVAAWAAWNWF